MRFRIPVTIALVLLTAWFAADRITAEDAPGAGAASEPHPVTIIASPAILPAGTVCRVELAPKRDKDVDGVETETVVTYTGTMTTTDDAGVVLKATQQGTRLAPILPPHMAKNPNAKRLFKTSGSNRPIPNGKEVRLAARDIRSITVVALPSPTVKAQ